MLPFSRDAFLEVFHAYNEGIWPAQLVLVALALLALVATIRSTPRASSFVAAILVALWLWMAGAYHFLYFTDINVQAWLFGALFVVEAGVLALAAISGRLAFGLRRGWTAWLGAAIVVYALLVYPMLGQWGDHAYPHSPTFGLPCPTTIFTFGLLLLTTARVPKRVLVIPVLWSAVASIAPLAFGIWEDLGLAASAIATVVALGIRDHVPRMARRRATGWTQDSCASST